MNREEALTGSAHLFEPCLRAVHFAPADKPGLEQLREMSSVHENGLRAAIALAYQAGHEAHVAEDADAERRAVKFGSENARLVADMRKAEATIAQLEEHVADVERPEHVALLLRDGLANFHKIVAAEAAKIADPQIAEAKRQFDQVTADRTEQHRIDIERRDDLIIEFRRQMASLEQQRLTNLEVLEDCKTELYDHTDPELAAVRRKYPRGTAVIRSSEYGPKLTTVKRPPWRWCGGTHFKIELEYGGHTWLAEVSLDPAGGGA